MRTALDMVTLVVFGGACGGAGWWCHAAVDEWRTRQMLARLHERLGTDGSGALDG